MIKLVRLSKKYNNQLTEMMDEWTNVNEKIIPSAITHGDYHQIEAYIKSIDDNSKRLVPSTTYFILKEDEQKFIGAVNIRHFLNDNLLLLGGHIGIGIRPSYRSKGYGKTAVKLALDICKKMNINEVLMTCDKNNIASRNMILSNQGVLENEEFLVDRYIQRFWIKN